MPEFPEVFTITKNLQNQLKNAVLLEVEYLDYHPKISQINELKQLENSKVIDVYSISKNIIIKFPNENYLVSHLAMTGRYRYSNKKELFGWDKIRFKFEKEDKIFFINFTDTRKFGKLILTKTLNVKPEINPLNINEEQIKKVISKVQKSKKTIKELMLDQNVISGLGNIYCNDTLHLSKINPETAGDKLSDEQIRKIISNAKIILELGIEKGGSSLYDKMYTDIYGNEGNYQDFFQVYNLKICKDCGKEITKKMLGGRGTYYCKNCLQL
jgi:formamidopyrimidine-DNA glycosylase